MSDQRLKSISVQELYRISQTQPVEVIDVRTPEEFREVRAAIVRPVPMDTIDPQQLMRARKLPADQPMYFICHLGGRSGRTCMALVAAGYANVVNVEGGTEAWEEAGLPVERGN
ncbi:MAG: rhodanese-like domain-containing protein [Pirellulales bacterium]